MNTKVAIAQIEVIPAQPRKNTKKMLEIIEEAKKSKVDIIIFPEMCIPGYMIGDTWERESFLRECESCGNKIRSAAFQIVVVFGNVAIDWGLKNEDGRVRKYNACFVAEDGKFAVSGGPRDFIIKTLQPNYREFDDNRHFFDYKKYIASRAPTSSGGRHSPVFLKNGLNLGCVLCEDAWDEDYTGSPIDEMADRYEIDLFINISCSPFTDGKNDKRNRVFSEKALKHETPMAYANCVGIQDIGKTIYTFDGMSCFYDSMGENIQAAFPFKEKVFSQILHTETGRFIDEERLVCHREEVFVDSNISVDPTPDNIGDLYKAIQYGTEKFMNRFGIDKVVIGVSGGIDSSLVAAIFSTIVKPENMWLINMPSKYNSATTKKIASELSENIGCNELIIPIGGSVALTKSQFEEAGLELTPFVLENIQARDRSSRILAAVAASVGGVFTCNANKSEMTVGYTTLYGDLGGFLAPISDLWKGQVYEMSKYFNQEVSAIIPQGSIDIVPSAELSDEQSVDDGEGDPLIYEYHDLLFSSWVERWSRATPEDILDWYTTGRLERELGWSSPAPIGGLFNFDKQQFVDDLERWWKCYQGLGVAKRIQAPPVLAVSRRAFGFDHREAQYGYVFSERYYRLKNQMGLK